MAPMRLCCLVYLRMWGSLGKKEAYTVHEPMMMMIMIIFIICVIFHLLAMLYCLSYHTPCHLLRTRVCSCSLSSPASLIRLTMILFLLYFLEKPTSPFLPCAHPHRHSIHSCQSLLCHPPTTTTRVWHISIFNKGPHQHVLRRAFMPGNVR